MNLEWVRVEDDHYTATSAKLKFSLMKMGKEWGLIVRSSDDGDGTVNETVVCRSLQQGQWVSLRLAEAMLDG